MFIQTTKTKRKGKIYYTHLVKEAFRTPKGPRSRTICNITKLSEEVRLLIGAALKGSELIFRKRAGTRTGVRLWRYCRTEKGMGTIRTRSSF